jgi:hypothetical protein
LAVKYGDSGAVVVLRWRGCLPAIGFGDSGAEKSLQIEANKLPCCE